MTSPENAQWPTAEPPKNNYKPFTIAVAVILGLIFASMALASVNSNSPPTQTPSQLLLSTSDKYFQKINGTAHVLKDDTLEMDFYDSDLDATMKTHLNDFMTDLGFQASAVALMWKTTAGSGVQTADAPNYSAVWTYNPSDGLELSVTVKR